MGAVNTHIDAFSHAGYDGFAFNGMDYAKVINMEEGAVELDVTAHGPIVTRGILADVARRRGVQYLQPGEWVTPQDIEKAAERLEILVNHRAQHVPTLPQPASLPVARANCATDPARRTEAASQTVPEVVMRSV